MEGKIRVLNPLLFIGCLFCFVNSYAQQATPFFKGAIKTNRTAEYHNIIHYLINENLSLPLNDSTEENWEDAFTAIGLTQYQSLLVNDCIDTAFNLIEKRSVEFQQALLTLSYSNYPGLFNVPVRKLFVQTSNEKIAALCVEYLLQSDTSSATKNFIINQINEQNALYGWNFKKNTISAIVLNRLFKQPEIVADKLLLPFLSADYLKKNVVVYSIQRKNRDYPGIVFVKDTAGNFVRNDDSTIFYVPQLARSISNLPFYLTDGNTPQGIFRMYQFGVSGAAYIGPTENIQLTMPYETSIQFFLNDSTIKDTVWSEYLYKKLLPVPLKEYLPLYETYYASQAGRTEIIAHGTTVNPQYYTGKPYYPQTPTEGCLCTKEIWSSDDGMRLESDEQQLVNAVKKAGGPNGYYIVLEIDDEEKPVSIKEILPFIGDKETPVVKFFGLGQ